MSALKGLALFAVAAFVVVLAGCKQRTTFKDADDTLWVDGELRVIFYKRLYVAPFMNFHGSGELTKQQWEMVKMPFPDQPGRSTTRHELFRVDGGITHFFSSVGDSDLLIHQVMSNPSGFERQYFLFDPATGKDVSNPFPSVPVERLWLNRSRRAWLTIEGKQAVIRDTLSARTGEPKVLARPPWFAVLERLKYGEYSAVFADDARHMILFPYTKSGRLVVESNYTAEVWSVDGAVEKFFLPLERKEGEFVDAELIDGQVLLMWRNLLSNGAEDGVELLNTKGETLHAGKISAFTHGPLWSPKHHEVLFPYYEGTGWDGELWRTYYLWNYSSNTVQQIKIKR